MLQASVRIAVAMAEEHLITEREALLRIDPYQMDYFMHPTIDPNAASSGVYGHGGLKIGCGIAASAGAATGAIVFSNEDAIRCAKEGRPAILCREETSSDDVLGFKV